MALSVPSVAMLLYPAVHQGSGFQYSRRVHVEWLVRVEHLRYVDIELERPLSQNSEYRV